MKVLSYQNIIKVLHKILLRYWNTKALDDNYKYCTIDIILCFETEYN